MRNFIYISLFFVTACAQTPKMPNWQSFEMVDQMVKSKPKKCLVYIYDPLCEDCTRVRMYALENAENMAYMAKHFYTMEISINEKDSIYFNDKSWKHNFDVVGRPFHELAQILNGEENITTPCITFLDEQLNMIAPIKKTVTAEELELLLVYVANNIYEEMPVEVFDHEYEYGSFTSK